MFRKVGSLRSFISFELVINQNRGDMKKGKRQVMEKNVFGEDEAANNQESGESHSTFQSNFMSQPISKPTRQQEDPLLSRVPNKNRPQASSFSNQSQIINQKHQQLPVISTTESRLLNNIMLVSHTTKLQLPSSKAEEQQVFAKQEKGAVKDVVDEKKNRIQMLKQKYLKKGAEVKPAAQVEEMTPTKQNTKVVASQQQIQKGGVQKVETSIKQPVQILRKIQEPIQTNIQISKSARKNEELPRRFKQREEQIVTKAQQKEQVVHQQAPTFQIKQPTGVKLPQRKSKVPPPPPPSYAKKPKIPPPKEEKEQQYEQNNVSSPQTTAQNIQIKQIVEVSPKQNRVKVPPPPPIKQSSTKTNTVQEILAKRLKKQDKVQQTQIQNMEFEQPSQPQRREVPIKLQSIQMPRDEQYQTEEKQQVSMYVQNTATQSIPEFDILQGIRIWCQDTEQPFSRLFSHSNKLSQLLYRRQQPKQLSFTSKNPTFNPIINRLIQQFVLRGKGELTEGQKTVLNQLALQFFYSDLKSLTTSFFILLVKLGKTYLKKYKAFFRNGLNKYLFDLIEYRDYFVDGELANFIDFLFEESLLQENDYFLVILLGFNQNLASNFANTQINDSKYLLLMLIACQHAYRSNKCILGLYLHLVSQLANHFSHEASLLQSVLKYLNKFQTHEKYYQLQKQLKLKVINIISKGQNQNQQKIEQGRATNQKKGENSGLMGFWSKAVDKIKSATTQIAEKEKTQPEEPEEDIRYDPVTKRYLVNGKAFEDQEASRRDENVSKLPPTPPPKPSRPAGPPPPPGNKKPRTVTAVNRYA